MKRSIIAGCAAICLLSFGVSRAQQTATVSVDSPVPLGQAAVAFDANGQRAIEATLRTTSLNGASDAPVTNVRIVLKNVSSQFYNFVSGHVSFYDSSGVRCGEAIFRADALAPNESVETDVPGLRVTCSASSWRIIATNLIPQAAQSGTASTSLAVPTTNLTISIDGEEHPIQLGKPLVLNLGDRQRTVVVRAAP